MEESHLLLELESPSDVLRTIKGEIAWEPVRDKLDEAYKELGKSITLKGFRKGKVPKSMLKKMFHRRIAAEISHTLVQEALVDAIGRFKLRPVMPIPSWEIDENELVDGEALGFKATLEVLPEVEAKVFEGLEIKRREATVSDEDVERYLKMKQEELTQYLPVENQEIVAGHVVRCDVMGKVGELPVSMEGLTFEVEAADKPTPGPAVDSERATLIRRLSAALIGTKPEPAERDLELEFDDSAPEDWRGKTAQLLVELEAVRERRIPDIDDDFARDLGEADTLDEYRALLRKQLLEMEEGRLKQDLRRQVEDALVAANPIEVTETLVEKQLNSVMERAQMAFQMRGISPEALGMDDDKLRDQFRNSAEQEVKKTLLTDAVAKQLEIVVSDEELNARLTEIAEARGESLERVKAEYEKGAGTEALRVVMREEKVLDLLLERAHVTQDVGSEDEPADTATQENAEKSTAQENGDPESAPDKQT